MKIFLVIGALGFIYLLIYKPEIVAVILFTLVISDINIELNGLPLNLRAIISIALFGRALIGNDKKTPFLLSVSQAIIVLFFILYMMMVSWGNDLLTLELTKEFALKIMCVYFGYHFFFLHKDFRYLRQGLIFGGLICVADLVYTYAVAGEFPVQRIYTIYFAASNGEFDVNHNFFGYICGIGFVFLFHEFLYAKKTSFLSLGVLLLLFFGVLMSTSRTAMVSMILIVVILLWRAIRSDEGGKKAYNVIMVSLSCVFLTIFLVQILQSSFGLSNTFFEFINTRLIDEPLALINKAMGLRYNVQYMDSVEWREEASSLAYTVFMELKTVEQLFGIGYGGFYVRDFGFGFDAHNGLLLLLIEAGAVGFLIYFWFVISLFIGILKYKAFSPVFTAFVFIFFFVITHNKELTGYPAFLIIGGMIGQLRYVADLNKKPENEREIIIMSNYDTKS